LTASGPTPNGSGGGGARRIRNPPTPISSCPIPMSRIADFAAKNFANLDPDEIAERGRTGGLTAQRTGRAHRLTREERS
jgi:hypothetical protein